MRADTYMRVWVCLGRYFWCSKRRKALPTPVVSAHNYTPTMVTYTRPTGNRKCDGEWVTNCKGVMAARQCVLVRRIYLWIISTPLAYMCTYTMLIPWWTDRCHRDKQAATVALSIHTKPFRWTWLPVPQGRRIYDRFYWEPFSWRFHILMLIIIISCNPFLFVLWWFWKCPFTIVSNRSHFNDGVESFLLRITGFCATGSARARRGVSIHFVHPVCVSRQYSGLCNISTIQFVWRPIESTMRFRMSASATQVVCRRQLPRALQHVWHLLRWRHWLQHVCSWMSIHSGDWLNLRHKLHFNLLYIFDCW